MRTSWISRQGGILEKGGGVDLKMGVMTPHTNYARTHTHTHTHTHTDIYIHAKELGLPKKVLREIFPNS